MPIVSNWLSISTPFQVLKLESENGRLIVQAHQNDALKGQIRQLQEDIRKDTDLRKELLSAIEVARLVHLVFSEMAFARNSDQEPIHVKKYFHCNLLFTEI